MAMTFLCPTHKDWLYFHSEQGIDFIEDAHRKGEYLVQQESWKKAVPFLGCAFEATEILLELYGKDKTWLLTELTLLAIQLQDCLKETGSEKYTSSISNRALRWLDAAVRDPATEPNKISFLKNCIESLTGKTSKVYGQGNMIPASVRVTH
ncbi:hypothetical protein J3L16_01040 [Alteromonas sp. 5E99-2]|uniref:hypothetical protein n=1 Tax=Alteromonas sp. 5E99-2 TaxID=2817683 RepID=UPI001A98E3C4|nr:hypothetical protein [Alteromonas sp. 5E99-2]MBO1254264.1 hypothetical protein [Alteromonas sp. 5E99-2]